jgi:hypothetical protein
MSRVYTLANILWAIVVILVVVWLLGLLLRLTGDSPLIHLLLVVAVLIVLYNLLVGRRTV